MTSLDFINKCKQNDVKFKIIDSEFNICLGEGYGLEIKMDVDEDILKKDIYGWKIEDRVIDIYV